MRLYFMMHYTRSAMVVPKSTPSSFRFQPQVKEALELIAGREGRSMANMLEWLIKKHCECTGLGWPPVQEAAPDATPAKKGSMKAAIDSNA